MKMSVVAIRDIAGDVYGLPIHVPHEALAVRTFTDQCLGRVKGDPVIAMHPEQFELYQLATYDDQTGTYTNDKKRLAAGATITSTGAN